MKTTPFLAAASAFALACCLLAARPAQAQQPAPAEKRGLPPVPGLGPDPVLRPGATPAEKAAYQQALTAQARQRWNYLLTDSTTRARLFNNAPNGLLVETVRGLPPGTALDADMGEGRNALYLAQLGWRVTGVDIAEKALAFAQARAQQLSVPLTTEVHDMATYDWGQNKWNLIVLSYAGGRDYAARVARALKPGGLVVLEAFHMDAAQQLNVVNGDYRVFFNHDELKKLYGDAGLTIVRYEEPVAPADFTKQTLRLVRLVAQKPQ